jgi:F-type H+-transporting ATPase subunit gamma
MASVQDLKRRVRSITNTRKVTKAMELVASARLRRAQQRIEAMRPYADRMQELMTGVAQAAGSVRLPLLERRDDVRKVAIVAITGDRGLAGGFNAQVLRRAFALAREAEAAGQEVTWYSSGRKGASTLRFRRMNVGHSWVGFIERATYADAQAMAHELSTAFVDETVDRVVIVYNAFESALVQRVTVSEVLPVPLDVLEEDVAEEAETRRLAGDFIYEPEPEEILARLLPVYVETEVYRALLESAASEHGARMTAMRNASKSAGELIENLTLAMNRARQAQITQEILEIVAGADALTG